MSPFWRVTADGVRVAVRVQPKSRRPGLAGAAPAVDGMRLRIGVSEPPEDGRASQAACAALARALHVPASAVQLLHGAASREKTLHVSGDPTTLAQILAGL